MRFWGGGQALEGYVPAAWEVLAVQNGRAERLGGEVWGEVEGERMRAWSREGVGEMKSAKTHHRDMLLHGREGGRVGGWEGGRK